MSEDKSFIIRPKDPSAIVRLQDPKVIEQILENPLLVLSEVITGYVMTGNGFGRGSDVGSLRRHSRVSLMPPIDAMFIRVEERPNVGERALCHDEDERHEVERREKEHYRHEQERLQEEERHRHEHERPGAAAATAPVRPTPPEAPRRPVARKKG